MVKRYLVYEDFRTIGIKQESNDNNRKLIVNETDLDVNKTFGGLVSLIGLNNSGKSNAVYGFKCLKDGIKDRDKPDFIYDRELKTNVKWVYLDTDHDFKIQYDAITKSYRVYAKFDTKEVTKKRISLDSSNQIKLLKQHIQEIRLSKFDLSDLFEITKAYPTKAKTSKVEAIMDAENAVLKEDLEPLKEKLKSLTKSDSLFFERKLIQKINRSINNDFSTENEYYLTTGNIISNLRTNITNLIQRLSLSRPTEKAFRVFLEGLNKPLLEFRNIQNVCIRKDIISKIQFYEAKITASNNATIKNTSYFRGIKQITNAIASSQVYMEYPNEILNTLSKINNDEIIKINGVFKNSINELSSLTSNLIDTGLVELSVMKVAIEKIQDYTKQIPTQNNHYNDISIIVKNLSKSNLNNSKEELMTSYYLEKNPQIDSALLEVPNIIDYTLEKGFKYEELELENITIKNVKEQIEKSRFFTRLFKLLEVDPKSIETAYKNSNRNRGAIRNVERDINERLVKISNEFNSLYFQDKKLTKYLFSVVVESGKIYFDIQENGVALALDKQSTGFKWFFDFYFSTISLVGLKPGDIILFDEPAINLHPQSQIELRKIMKDFSVKNDVTIILSTHSPFLVDMDHLDELRIIRKETLVTRIDNKFTNFDEFNVVEPIQTALTIERFMMFNPKNNVVFVEGITDYNYLNAFKFMLNKHNITFVPIQGLKDYPEEKIEMISKMFRNPLILLDADIAGKDFAVKCQKHKNISVLLISEVGDNINQLEDLFTKGDKEKYRISLNKEDKRYYRSENFKNKVQFEKDNIGKVTIQKFTKLLDLLEIS